MAKTSSDPIVVILIFTCNMSENKTRSKQACVLTSLSRRVKLRSADLRSVYIRARRQSMHII